MNSTVNATANSQINYIVVFGIGFEEKKNFHHFKIVKKVMFKQSGTSHLDMNTIKKPILKHINEYGFMWEYPYDINLIFIDIILRIQCPLFISMHSTVCPVMCAEKL